MLRNHPEVYARIRAKISLELSVGLKSVVELEHNARRLVNGRNNFKAVIVGRCCKIQIVLVAPLAPIAATDIKLAGYIFGLKGQDCQSKGHLSLLDLGLCVLKHLEYIFDKSLIIFFKAFDTKLHRFTFIVLRVGQSQLYLLLSLVTSVQL